MLAKITEAPITEAPITEAPTTQVETTKIKAQFTKIWLRILLLAATIAVAVALAFAGVLRADFISYDDPAHVLNNPNLNPVTVDSVMDFWDTPWKNEKLTKYDLERSPHKQLYSPLTFSAWAVLAHWARLPAPRTTPDLETHTLNPFFYHSFSLALHITNALLIFLLLLLLVENDWAAAAGALLFGLHPVQVEPVAWISATNNLLSGFFALLSIGLFLMCVARRPTAQRAPLISIYAAATLCFGLALLAKPSAVVIPFMVVILARWKFGVETRPLTKMIAPWLVLGIGCILINQLLQRSAEQAITPLWVRPFIAGDALAFYLMKVLRPLPLLTSYGHSTQWVLSHWWGYFNWIFPVALAIVCWRLRKKAPWLAVAAGLFVLGVLPMLGLVPYYYHQFSTVADRYLYLALLGPAFLTGTLLSGASKRNSRVSSAIWGFCALWLLLLGWQSYAQVPTWRNTFVLYSYLLSVNPNQAGWHRNLASAYIQRGDPERGFLLLRRSLQLDDASPRSHSALGDLLVQQGRDREAAAHFRAAARLDLESSRPRVSLANILKSQGQTAQAIALYREALKINPQSFTAHYNLALTLDQLGQSKAAIPHFQSALQFNPNDAQTHNAFALALAKTGKMDEAIASWQQAVALDPKLADARINLGAALAMTGQIERAIPLWQEALELNPDNPQVHFNLGQALAQQGQLDQAIAHWKTSLRLQPDYPQAKLALAKALQSKAKPGTKTSQ